MDDGSTGYRPAMSSIVVIAVIVVGVLLLAVAVRLLSRAQVPARLEAADDAGTGHGDAEAQRAPTGRPGDPGTEDQLPYPGDAGPGRPIPPPR